MFAYNNHMSGIRPAYEGVAWKTSDIHTYVDVRLHLFCHFIFEDSETFCFRQFNIQLNFISQKWRRLLDDYDDADDLFGRMNGANSLGVRDREGVGE